MKLAYVWGWTLVKFMEARYGRETIRRIVSTCADGDVFRATGLDRRQFEVEWKEWLVVEMAEQSEESTR